MSNIHMLSISIHHNSKFSFDNIQSILDPLFGNYYGSKKLNSIISNADHIWCVYDKKQNRYLGCALVKVHSKDNLLHIKLFGIEKSSQGQGIGTCLLEKIRNWANKNKYFSIIVHTQINNHTAIRLYEKIGFQKEYYVRNYYRPYGLLSTSERFETDAYKMILHL